MSSTSGGLRVSIYAFERRNDSVFHANLLRCVMIMRPEVPGTDRYPVRGHSNQLIWPRT